MIHLFAYLDAGTGSAIAALVAGGFAGVAVTVKFYWRRLLVSLHIRKPEEVETAPRQPDAT
ncbi:MAG: hypothetical protein ACR2J6_07210 [Thermoleophilaceae bacterium]